ncbi:hypothetical protein ACFLWE_00355 [Chloroflexota bacterium]
MGKRSGNGFVAHKATLANGLSRTLAERLMVQDITIGRKGFLGYLKGLASSNIVKIVPAPTDDSVSHIGGDKRLKVICGSHTSFINDMAWIGDKTPMTMADVRVSPNITVIPNMGSLELAEALDRVMPFTATEDNRPVLQCVLFKAVEGKLSLVSADGFRLAVQSLEVNGLEGEVLIHRDDLRGIANALRKAKRVNIGFEKSGDTLDGNNLVIATEVTSYKFPSVQGTFPDYEKLIPTQATTTGHLDTVEVSKAITSLKALAETKDYPIDVSLNGCIILSNADGKGQSTIQADIEGMPIKFRIDGRYLSQALKACGGMVDLKLTEANSPLLFKVEGFYLVVMPLATPVEKKSEAEGQAEGDENTAEEAVKEAEAVIEGDPITGEATPGETETGKTKRKHRKKEPVTV